MLIVFFFVAAVGLLVGMVVFVMFGCKPFQRRLDRFNQWMGLGSWLPWIWNGMR